MSRAKRTTDRPPSGPHHHFGRESLARGLGDSALPFGGRVPLQASVVSERDEKNACPATTGDIYDYRALHEEALRLLLN